MVFINSFNKYFLSFCLGSGMVLNAEGTRLNNTAKIPALIELIIWWA